MQASRPLSPLGFYCACASRYRRAGGDVVMGFSSNFARYSDRRARATDRNQGFGVQCGSPMQNGSLEDEVQLVTDRWRLRRPAAPAPKLQYLQLLYLQPSAHRSCRSHLVLVKRHSLCKDLLEYARATWHGAGLNGLGGLPLGGLLELEVGIVTVREYACAFPSVLCSTCEAGGAPLPLCRDYSNDRKQTVIGLRRAGPAMAC